jgi:hypothetical protein
VEIGAYNRAAAAIRRDERSTQQALAELKQLGYRVS